MPTNASAQAGVTTTIDGLTLWYDADRVQVSDGERGRGGRPPIPSPSRFGREEEMCVASVEGRYAPASLSFREYLGQAAAESVACPL